MRSPAICMTAWRLLHNRPITISPQGILANSICPRSNLWHSFYLYIHIQIYHIFNHHALVWMATFYGQRRMIYLRRIDFYILFTISKVHSLFSLSASLFYRLKKWKCIFFIDTNINCIYAIKHKYFFSTNTVNLNVHKNELALFR